MKDSKKLNMKRGLLFGSIVLSVAHGALVARDLPWFWHGAFSWLWSLAPLWLLSVWVLTRPCTSWADSTLAQRCAIVALVVMQVAVLLYAINYWPIHWTDENRDLLDVVWGTMPLVLLRYAGVFAIACWLLGLVWQRIVGLNRYRKGDGDHTEK